VHVYVTIRFQNDAIVFMERPVGAALLKSFQLLQHLPEPVLLVGRSVRVEEQLLNMGVKNPSQGLKSP
jgi:hypothetical protein